MNKIPTNKWDNPTISLNDLKSLDEIQQALSVIFQKPYDAIIVGGNDVWEHVTKQTQIICEILLFPTTHYPLELTIVVKDTDLPQKFQLLTRFAKILDTQILTGTESILESPEIFLSINTNGKVQKVRLEENDLEEKLTILDSIESNSKNTKN